MPQPDDDTIAATFRLMPPETRRAISLDLIEHADDRYLLGQDGQRSSAPDDWTQRVYVCEACGRQTRTIGGELPHRATCFYLVADPSRPRGKTICGGKLALSWTDE